MRSLVLFNNKGGVGKTTLTFNVAHMMARSGLRCVLADFDPQCNLSVVTLGETTLFDIWEGPEGGAETVAACIALVRSGKGDVVPPKLRAVANNLWILAGDLALSRFEQVLAESWGQVHQTDNERALHVTTSLQRLADRAAETVDADVALIDVGPNLGALNRASLLAADAVIVPVAPDLFSIQGLKNIGPTLVDWRSDWARVEERSNGRLSARHFEPKGYIVQQHLARVDRPVAAYDRWSAQIPDVFHRWVLEEKDPALIPASREVDPYCVGMIKHFASLVPLAQLARKPIFDLKQADGIGGGQIQAVARARAEIEELVKKLRRILQV